VEIKIECKLSSGELILRQGFGNENIELTLCQGNTERTFYVGAAEFARVVKFLSEVNRAYNI
jgi:hypothetical protein